VAISLLFLASPALSASYKFTPINYPGVTITAVTGINETGQIVGEYGAGGHASGFRGTLIPSIIPSIMLLLARQGAIAQTDFYPAFTPPPCSYSAPASWA
jgi:hypothetical protein